MNKLNSVKKNKIISIKIYKNNRRMFMLQITMLNEL